MAPSISFGLIDGRPVFMDERDDSYFLLDHDVEPEFLRRLACDGQLQSATPDLRETLGTDGDEGFVAFANCRRPRRSLVVERDALDRARPGDALHLAGILFGTRRKLAQRPIEPLLAEVRQIPSVGAGQPELGRQQRLVHRARRFLAARPLVPLRPNCLLDSLSLLRWLGSDREGSMLVFGVKLDPFAAHCWVQTDTLLLNDRVDIVERFGPVRVLRCSPVTQ